MSAARGQGRAGRGRDARRRARHRSRARGGGRDRVLHRPHDPRARSEYDRPETIEETAELVTAAGGTGIAVAVDHLEAEQVAALVERIDAEHGRLDVLVNDIWGGEQLFEWNTPMWEHDLDNGLRMLRLAIDTHLITSHFALPLLIRDPGGLVVEMTDGTREYNADAYRLDVLRPRQVVGDPARVRAGEELAPHGVHRGRAHARAGCARR